jgi:nicotinamidase-related amidase
MSQAISLNGGGIEFSLEHDYFLKFRDESVFKDPRSVKGCFEHFDKDSNGVLNIHEFEDLLKQLFSFNGTSYFMQKSKIDEMFNYFDSNQKKSLSPSDFENFWFKIIKSTILPKSSLIIVDVQNDFISGTLALSECPAKQDGQEVLPYINDLIDTVPFDVITYSWDWHPADHCSFIENVHKRKLAKNSRTKGNEIKVYDHVTFEDYPELEQKLWPAHCIQGSKGSELHPDLRVVDEKTDPMGRAVVDVFKGQRSDIDSYSAFYDNCKLNETTLHRDLSKHNITDLYVCGLAADVCVAATSAHGLDLNYRVIYIEDASRGVDIDAIKYEKKQLVKNGSLMIQTKQVKNMVSCIDRRPELAYATFDYLIQRDGRK